MKAGAATFSTPDDALKRINAIVSDQLGIGTFEGDPLESITVKDKAIFGGQAREQYRGLDMVARVIQSPARDALKNGFTLKTNYDETVDLGRLIAERLEELDYKKHLEQFVINFGLYSRGALMYPVLQESQMDRDRTHLRNKLDYSKIEKIEKINIVREDLFFYIIQAWDPLARDFEDFQKLTVGGQDVHKSRVFHRVDNLDPVMQRGVSMLQRIITALRGVNMANWTISNLLMRYRTAVLSYPAAEAAKMASDNAGGGMKSAIGKLIQKIKMNFTSKSIASIPDNYKLEYVETSFTGIKEAVDFQWDYVAAVTHIPQSIFKGSAQGELASAKRDGEIWNAHVKADYQVGLLEPAVKWLCDLIKWEQAGEVFQACQKYGISPDDVTVEIDWNPLDVPDPLSAAQIDNMEVQTAILEIQNGIKTVDEVKRDRSPEKDDFAMVPEFDPSLPGNDPLGLFKPTEENGKRVMPEQWRALAEKMKTG